MSNPRVPPQLTVGPFTTQRAAELGVRAGALQGPQWRHVFRNVWVHRDVPDTREVRVSAVRLILTPGAFVCGPTAAWLYGPDVQDPRTPLVWVGHETGRRPRVRAGTLVREISVAPSDIHLWAGIAMTTQLRTVFDCARWLRLSESLVVADYFAHLRVVSATQLAEYAAVRPGLRGMKQLKRVIDLIEPRTESPMESRLRLLLVLAGLTGFEPQYEVTNGDRFVARVDFAYVAERLIVEYDGSHHWQQRRADDRRRDAIRALGWTVIVVSAEDYYQQPQLIVEAIRAHLARARATR